jgi:hypothetical protein
VRGVPSSSAYQCPSRGHRVKDDYGVACDRFATGDPPTARQGCAYEEDGQGIGTETLWRQACMVTGSCAASVDASCW